VHVDVHAIVAVVVAAGILISFDQTFVVAAAVAAD